MSETTVPLHVLTREHTIDGGASARAILSQLVELLERLVNEEVVGSIDLRASPLSPWDLEVLQETLGEGEVRAEVDTIGLTRVAETGIPAVWWVTHYSEDGGILAEFLEVNYCPDILIAPEEDIHDGISVLKAKLFEDRDKLKG